MSTPHSKRLGGIQGDGFKVELEYNKDYVIVHFKELEKMTKEVFNNLDKLLVEWYEFLSILGVKFIWAGVEQDNTLINKLAITLGFKYIDSRDNLNVYRYGEE